MTILSSLARRMSRGAAKGGTQITGTRGLLRLACAFAALLGACSEPSQPLPARQRQHRSAYVPMRDGTRIAVDVHLPAGLAAEARIPAILRITRYAHGRPVLAARGHRGPATAGPAWA